jgi:translation elongation factor EF-1alpha
VPCRIAALISELNAETGEVIRSGHRVRFLTVKQAGIMDLDLEEVLCVECLPGNSPLSRLVLRIEGAMVAMGTAVEVLNATT